MSSGLTVFHGYKEMQRDQVVSQLEELFISNEAQNLQAVDDWLGGKITGEELKERIIEE